MVVALPDISIRQLEYLVAVADAPTFAAAAEHVGVSPSALSQGLSELERRIGVPLFEAVGRRRVLRDAAAPALTHARQVVALTGDLARWAERSRDAAVGQIRVGMIDVAAVHHCATALERFRSDRPDVDLHLRVAPSGSLLDALVAGELDLVVCVEPDPVPVGVTVEHLLTEPLAVYRPDGKRAGPPAGWGPWVLFPDGSQTRRVVGTALQSLGAPVDITAESHQPDVLREMVHLGLGWTVLPVVQAETGDRPLGRARILTDRSLVIAMRDTTVVDPAAHALREALDFTRP